jgi:hypothetical protein
VPPEARRRLSDGLTASRARHLLMTRALATILRHFATSDLAVIVLKGPVLAETVYPDPALRPFSDLDLLVRPEDRRRADLALRALGYQPLADEHSWDFDIAFDGATVYESAAGVRVDLHWGAADGGTLRVARAGGRGGVGSRGGAHAGGRARAGPGARGSRTASRHALRGPSLADRTAASVGPGAGARAHADRLVRAAATRTSLAGSAPPCSSRSCRCPLFLPMSCRGECWGACARCGLRTGLGVRAWLLMNLHLGTTAQRRQRLEHVVTLLLIDRTRDVIGSVGRALCPSRAWLRARYGRDSVGVSRLYLAHLRHVAGVVGGTGRRP